MTRTTADVLIDTISAWGVDTIFGLPGDGINGIMEALRKRQSQVRFIQVRHEESAAFMACGYAKHTGRLGCCLATSGPGGIHLLNGLYDAKLDGAPVLAITGMQFHDLVHTHSQQDVELDKLFTDACVYNVRCMGPEHIENIATLACRMALTRRGVAHICVPVDFQEKPVAKDSRSARNVPHHVSEEIPQWFSIPCNADLKDAAEILNSGRKTAILAGRGALNATEELEVTAEILGAPIVKALLGKAAVPDDSPYTTGGIGLLGTAPSQEALEECDTLLIAGSSFPYIEFLPKPGEARGVQIDSDATRIGLRYPVEIGLVGDCKRTLRALVPLLKRNKKRGFLNDAQRGMREWRRTLEGRAAVMSMPMKPQVVAAELGRRMPEDAIVNCDSGTVATWWAQYIPAKRAQKHTVSGTLASMACGLPYTVAAQIAYPDRLCVAFVGDGAMTMLLGELATAVRYKLPIKVIVMKNNSLGMIRWEQMVFLGNPEFECDLQPIDFAAVARAMGATGFTLKDPKRCGPLLDEALATSGPVVVEAIVDPNEPPQPPKITAKQAAHLAEALAKGTPGGSKIITNVVKQQIRELL
jgi:pyruvate dehydrogenase (quinone)/pyruvate oxidase